MSILVIIDLLGIKVRSEGVQRQAHLETAVVRLVSQLYGRRDGTLSADMPLLEEGLDSLAMTEVASQLRTLSGVHLASGLVFAHPTPRSIAGHATEGGTTKGRALQCGRLEMNVRPCSPEKRCEGKCLVGA